MTWNDSCDDEEFGNPYRSHPEQYKWVNRDFQFRDRVIFVGPPDDEYQPGMIAVPKDHKLYKKRGTIVIGRSEDILVFPDEPDENTYWDIVR